MVRLISFCTKTCVLLIKRRLQKQIKTKQNKTKQKKWWKIFTRFNRRREKQNPGSNWTPWFACLLMSRVVFSNCDGPLSIAFCPPWLSENPMPEVRYLASTHLRRSGLAFQVSVKPQNKLQATDFQLKSQHFYENIRTTCFICMMKNIQGSRQCISFDDTDTPYTVQFLKPNLKTKTKAVPYGFCQNHLTS